MKQSYKGMGVVGVVVMAILGGVILFGDKQTQAPATNTASDTAKQSAANTTVVTKDEVAKHSTKDDCWTIINDAVYDITSYISRHPGGDEIERACGIDGTTLFTQRETTDGEQIGSGTAHSGNAQNQLSNFLVGQLAK